MVYSSIATPQILIPAEPPHLIPHRNRSIWFYSPPRVFPPQRFPHTLPSCRYIPSRHLVICHHAGPGGPGIVAAAVMSMMKWRNGNNEPSLHQADGCSPLCQRGMLCYKSTLLQLVLILSTRGGLFILPIRVVGCAIAVVRRNFYSIKSDLNFFSLLLLPPQSQLTPGKSLYGILVSDILTTLSTR